MISCFAHFKSTTSRSLIYCRRSIPTHAVEMIRKYGFFYILAVIASTGVMGKEGSTELYSKLLKSHNYLVPPSSTNISVVVKLELISLVQLDTTNQEMTFTAVLNLKWIDSTLSWNRKEFPQVNRLAVPSHKIWTPNVLILNSRSNNIQSSGDDLFISADGQVHWPVFGEFKTSCTIDVTYYPFDQQTCIVKVGSLDRSILFEYDKNSIDLDQFYMSVFWDIITAPAYLNVYTSDSEDFSVETDVTYYLVIKRRTHWLSEVYPLLAFAFMTVIPAMMTKPMEKLILQVFCMAGLFALHMNLMHKLPPTSLVTPSASKYIVLLILYNFIHLTLTTVMNNRRGCFQWIVQQIPLERMAKRFSRVTESGNDEEEKKAQQDIETEKCVCNQSEGRTVIVDIFNWIILVVLVLAVVASTLFFILNKPH